MASNLTMVFPAISILDPYCYPLHCLTMEALHVVKLVDKTVTVLESVISRPTKFDHRYEACRLSRTNAPWLLVVVALTNWMGSLSECL